MNLKEAKLLLKEFVEKEIGVSILFIGGVGIGKSYLPKELAKELGIGYDGIFPSQMGDGGEMTGLPYRDGEWQKWSRPENLPSLSPKYKCKLCNTEINHNHKKGIYVIDELNTARADIRHAMMEFLLSGSINRNQLEGFWLRVACINPDNGEHQVEPLSKALLRRVIQIKLEPDTESWVSWAKTNSLDDDIVSIIKDNPNFLAKVEKFDVEASPNPDAHRMISEIKSKSDWDSILSNIKFEIIQGLCGKEYAVFATNYFVKKQKFVTAKEVFSNLDLKTLLSQSNDKLSKTIDSIAEFVNKSFKKEHLEPLVLVLEGIPAEFRETLLVNITEETKEKIHSTYCKKIHDKSVDNLKQTLNEEILKLKAKTDVFSRWKLLNYSALVRKLEVQA